MIGLSTIASLSIGAISRMVSVATFCGDVVAGDGCARQASRRIDVCDGTLGTLNGCSSKFNGVTLDLGSALAFAVGGCADDDFSLGGHIHAFP